MAWENYYSGDGVWERFSNYYITLCQGEPEVHELAQKLGGRMDLACTIYGTVGCASKWIYKNLEMLDGLRPVDCLADEKLTRRLREMLLRMPC